MLKFPDFNSIKVQLERIARRLCRWCGEFQFHKGTIRTELEEETRFEDALFQFHKGTIRTVISITSFLLFANFNSIKVQLELMFMALQTLIPSFQFHKGTIRT